MVYSSDVVITDH